MLKIYSPSLAFLAEVDNFESCIITRKYLGIETLELKINLNANHAERLQTHNIIYAGENKVFEILHREINNIETDILQVTAYGFGKTLAKRIIEPPLGKAHDKQSGSRDAIVKTWITNSLINATNTDRNISYMAVAATHGTDSITEQSRYKNLNEEVMRVLASDNRGYKFNIVSGKVTFDTYMGIDRTATNGVNPPCIFSTEFDNVLEQQYIESLSSAQNLIYAGGQGEGADRNIVAVGDDTSYERFETFIDCRDTGSNTELTNRGVSEQNFGSMSFEAIVNPNSNLTYGIDYDLGDTVSIVSKLLNLQVDRKIEEIKEFYQAGESFKIEITFGEPAQMFISEVKSQSNSITQLATSENSFVSSLGGNLVSLINKTGAPSVKGTLVAADTTTDGAFKLANADSNMVIGIVYDDGVPDGASCRIVISGIAQVLLQDSTASTRGYWVKSSTTQPGRADATRSAPEGGTIAALENHMEEVGHCIESKTAGTNVLAKCIIHFN